MVCRMRPGVACAVVLMLAGCAESPPPEPAHPRAASAPAPAAPPPEPDYSAAIQEQQAANAKMVADAVAAQEASTEAIIEQGKAARHAQRAEQAEEARKQCASTRDKRASAAKWAVKQRIELESKLKQRAREVAGACKLVERKTGAVNVQRSGSGLRVSAETQDDVTCSGGVPKGFTKQEVWVVLARIREGGTGSVDPSDLIMAREDHDRDDEPCKMFDAEVGLDMDVRYSDGEGLKRLLTWKPPADAAAN